MASFLLTTTTTKEHSSTPNAVKLLKTPHATPKHWASWPPSEANVVHTCVGLEVGLRTPLFCATDTAELREIGGDTIPVKKKRLDGRLDAGSAMTLEQHMSNASHLASWRACFPIDASGMPTSDAAARLLMWLFQHRNRFTHVDEITGALHLPDELVRIMCRQLLATGLVASASHSPLCYAYNVRCRNATLQARLESHLIDLMLIPHQQLPSLPSAA